MLLRSILFFLIFIRGAGAYWIGSGDLVIWYSSGYTHIYDLCGGMISYMQVIFYIHVMIPAYGYVY